MVMRDPRDNIRSILDRLELPGDEETLDPTRIEEVSEGWKRTIDGSWMGIEDGNYIVRLSERWNRAARTYLEHQNDIELIRYEDFCRAKVESIDDLVSRLGEEKINEIEEKVDRQFQPRGHLRDVEWLSFYGETNLNRIERRCEEEMSALGYDDFRTK